MYIYICECIFLSLVYNSDIVPFLERCSIRTSISFYKIVDKLYSLHLPFRCLLSNVKPKLVISMIEFCSSLITLLTNLMFRFML